MRRCPHRAAPRIAAEAADLRWRGVAGEGAATPQPPMLLFQLRLRSLAHAAVPRPPLSAYARWLIDRDCPGLLDADACA
jgi:hypothetical protein